uniref:Uncharacterized protein n=1 Tax=Geladintestivirus 4 TaxID=3233136 RepID=A0AAU8MG37_9CAUD
MNIRMITSKLKLTGCYDYCIATTTDALTSALINISIFIP